MASSAGVKPARARGSPREGTRKDSLPIWLPACGGSGSPQRRQTPQTVRGSRGSASIPPHRCARCHKAGLARRGSYEKAAHVPLLVCRPLPQMAVIQASSVVAKPQLHSRIMATSHSCSLGLLGIYGSELPLYRRADRGARSGKAEACGQLAPRALKLAGRQSADIMLAHRRQASCGFPARPALRRACGVVQPV
jgi:hypothetical protein